MALQRTLSHSLSHPPGFTPLCSQDFRVGLLFVIVVDDIRLILLLPVDGVPSQVAGSTSCGLKCKSQAGDMSDVFDRYSQLCARNVFLRCSSGSSQLPNNGQSFGMGCKPCAIENSGFLLTIADTRGLIPACSTLVGPPASTPFKRAHYNVFQRTFPFEGSPLKISRSSTPRVRNRCLPKFTSATGQYCSSGHIGGLFDAISRGERDGFEDGGRIILPMSFTGSLDIFLYTVEFQKRVLPHYHTLLWVDSASKIQEPKDVDRVILAEIPDPSCALSKKRHECIYNQAPGTDIIFARVSRPLGESSNAACPSRPPTEEIQNYFEGRFGYLTLKMRVNTLKIFGHTLKSCSAKDLTEEKKAIKETMKPFTTNEVNTVSNDGWKSVGYRRNGYERGGFSTNRRGTFGSNKGGYMNNGGRGNGISRQYVLVKINERSIVNKEEHLRTTKKDQGNNDSMDKMNTYSVVENVSVSGSNSKKAKTGEDLKSNNRFSVLNNEENSEDIVKWRELYRRIDIMCDMGIVAEEEEKVSWIDAMLDYYLDKWKKCNDKSTYNNFFPEAFEVELEKINELKWEKDLLEVDLFVLYKHPLTASIKAFWSEEMIEYYEGVCKDIKNDRINGYFDDVVGGLNATVSFLASDEVSNLHDESMAEMQGERVQKSLDKDPYNALLKEEEMVYSRAYTDAVLDEEKLLKLKTKIEWLKEGDHNTMYFHKVLKCRVRKSRIEVVTNDAGNTFYGDDIPAKFVEHFKNFFGAVDLVFPIEDCCGLFTKKLDPQVASVMIRHVMDKEIKAAMFDIKDDKAAGLDGFTLKFFKKAWDIVGLDDLMVGYDWKSGTSNCAFKVDIKKAKGLDEFSMCSGLYPSMEKSTSYFCNVLNDVKVQISIGMPFKEERVQKSLDKDPYNALLKEEEMVYSRAYTDAVLDEEKLLKLKTKIEWLKEGDHNTMYFHKVLKCRVRKSRIEVVTNDAGNTFYGDDIPANDWTRRFKDVLDVPVPILNEFEDKSIWFNKKFEEINFSVKEVCNVLRSDMPSVKWLKLLSFDIKWSREVGIAAKIGVESICEIEVLAVIDLLFYLFWLVDCIALIIRFLWAFVWYFTSADDVYKGMVFFYVLYGKRWYEA
nr:hypothetical protein [Tanacetum cinerariifolium]